MSPSYPTRKEANEAKKGYLELEHADQLWADVARLEEQLARKRAQAESASSEPKTIGELIEDYVAYLRDHRQRKPETVSTTRYQLNGLLKPIADMPVRALTVQRAEALYRKRAAGCAAATHHGNLRQSRSLWRWAMKKKLTRTNVWLKVEAIGTPNEGKEQLHPTAAAQVFRRALEQAASGPPADHRKRHLHRGSATVLILLIFGMRPKEIVSLKPTELDRGLLYVCKGKSRKSRRWLRMPDVVWQALKPHVMEARAQGRKRIFPFKPDFVRRHTFRLCEEEGVSKVCAYSLRGTHATLATEAGATAEMVADQLGHAGTGITFRHYIDPAAKIEASAAKVFSELFSGVEGPQDEDLGAQAAYEALVDIPSTQCSERPLVVPSQPEASYLVNKITGMDICQGSQMPKVGSLPPSEQQLILNWISAGAPNN